MELIMNNLNVIWFILLCVLFAGFFFLEGFDYGTGILLPVIGKTDVERRQMINALGPIWDGNEVWMITAGGALFASFPHVYATLFSGFYMALFLMLAVLIMNSVPKVQIAHGVKYLTIVFSSVLSFLPYCGA